MKAFPRPNTIHPDDLGMDLRDYFAAKAMQSLITHYGAYGEESGTYGCDYKIPHVDEVSEYAYTQADAMMEARKK
jgi:hypothetical protein